MPHPGVAGGTYRRNYDVTILRKPYRSVGYENSFLSSVSKSGKIVEYRRRNGGPPRTLVLSITVSRIMPAIVIQVD